MSYKSQQAAARRAANVRKSWIERKAKEKESGHLHCVCVEPRPSQDGFWVKLYGTVECAACMRAIFSPSGEPVRS